MGKWQVSVGGGNAARWRDDGREIYFLSGASVVAVEVDGDTSPVVGAQETLFAAPRGVSTAVLWYAPGYDVSGDGERFISTYSASDVPSATINIVVNWQTALAAVR